MTDDQKDGGAGIAQPQEEKDARRYRRLRVLGCAPGTWEGLNRTKPHEQGTVLCFTNLDRFIDDDLLHIASRGEADPAPSPALAAILQEKIAEWRSWSSECWNPINPHARTCQNGEKPCELCAAVIQTRKDAADELEALLGRRRAQTEERL